LLAAAVPSGAEFFEYRFRRNSLYGEGAAGRAVVGQVEVTLEQLVVVRRLREVLDGQLDPGLRQAAP